MRQDTDQVEASNSVPFSAPQVILYNSDRLIHSQLIIVVYLVFLPVYHHTRRSIMWWLQVALGVALLPKILAQTDAFEFSWPGNTNQCGVSTTLASRSIPADDRRRTI
jgi:hypothetical protein